MTPTEEATFISLWQEGLTHEAMARQLGWPVGTVKSRLHTLLQQGKIQPRRSTAAHPSTPVGTPQHTVKKTYVVDTLYVDLIERYAKAEGVELKDVVNLAFHEFFEWRQYVPSEG